MKRTHILIIKLGSLGDVVQAEGLYRDIRAHHPDALITVMTSPPYRDFFERCPWVDQVLLDPRKARWNLAAMLDLRAKMRAVKADMVYDLQQSRRTSFYYRWFMADVDWMGKAPGCKFQFPNPPHRCAMDQYADQLACLGIPNGNALKPDLGWMADEVEPLLREAGLCTPYVVLVPGSSKGHKNKRWPHYRELAIFLTLHGLAAVIVPGPDERTTFDSFTGATVLKRDDCCLDYFALAGVIKNAAFVVGNDTGPMHIAAHLQRFGLVLFNKPSTAQKTGMQHSRLNWLQSDNLHTLPLARVVAEISQRLLNRPPILPVDSLRKATPPAGSPMRWNSKLLAIGHPGRANT